MKVLFVSVLYMPRDMTSDKQFVRDLISMMPGNVTPVVWTVNDWATTEVLDNINGKQVRLYCSKRFLHKPRYDSETITEENNWTYSPHHPHGEIRQLIELASSFYAAIVNFKRIVNKERPDIIHITDNWGPIAWLIKCTVGDIPVTSSKPTVRIGADSSTLYKMFVKTCLYEQFHGGSTFLTGIQVLSV